MGRHSAASAGRPVATCTKDLPLELVEGLSLLARMRPPRLRDQGAWAEVVRDAETIAADGWAEQALALGWQPLEIFGCGKRGSGDFESLAIWVAGRRVVLLDDASAIATDGPHHAVFNRRRNANTDFSSRAVFLWDLGAR